MTRWNFMRIHPARILRRALRGRPVHWTRVLRSAGAWWRYLQMFAVLPVCVAPLSPGTIADAPAAAPQVAAVDAASPNPVEQIRAALARCGRSLTEVERWQIAGAIHYESRRHGYDPLFVLAMVEVESACSPTARGVRGSVGLIQVLPTTARAVAREAGVSWQGVEALTRPSVNMQLGLHYLAQLEARFRDPAVALAAYQMGPRRVARMPRHRARDTRYVRKILARYENLLAGAATGST